VRGVPVDRCRLWYWRHKRLMERREVAEKAGIALSTYANLESGFAPRGRIKTVRAIARALGVSAEKLVDTKNIR
jgi:transcriptional regulator with XRE-family HTH domain